MSANPEHQNSTENGFENQAVRTRLEAISNGLVEGMEQDARLASGVPQEQRGDALDFIQMSGLTRPVANLSQAPTSQPNQADQPADGMDPTQPVSFYEKGIADVDHTMGPAAMESTTDAAHENLVPPPPPILQPIPAAPLVIQPSKSVDAFKDIIAELTNDSQDSASSSVPAPLPQLEPKNLAENSVKVSDSVPGGLGAPTEEDISRANDTVDGTPEDIKVKSPELELASQLPPVEAEELPAPSNAEELDFDSLLNVADIPEATAIIEEPGRAAPVSNASHGDGDLQQAEQFLEELEEQPRSEGATTKAVVDEQHALGMNCDLSATREDNLNRWEWPEQDESETINEEAGTTPRRRSHRHRGWKRRMVRRLVLLVSLCLIITGGAIVYITVIAPSLSQPEDLRDLAASHIASRQFTEASEAYVKLANKYPESSQKRGEALFNAAQVLYRSPQTNGPSGEVRYEQILNYLRAFTKEQPNHAKRTRANLLIGVALFKTGAYDEAVAILKIAANEQSDSIATLPILRSLARAYTQTEEYEQAESTYLQAVALKGNYSLDVDYYELGQIYTTQARTAGSENTEAQLLKTAEAYWTKAMQVPSIDPARREDIRREITALATQNDTTKLPELTIESTTSARPTEATDGTLAGEFEQSELEALVDTSVPPEFDDQ